MLRKLLVVSAAMLVALVVGILISGIAMQRANLQTNARQVPAVDAQQLAESFERTVGWAQANREKILASENYYLWWFIDLSAQLTGDARLFELMAAYRARYFKPRQPRKLNYLLLGEDTGPSLTYPKKFFDELNHYDKALAYSKSCDRELGLADGIVSQLDVDHCDGELAKDIRSACTTHQVMALYFIAESGCAGAPATEPTLSNLLAQTRALLATDPRLGDVYIQRVLWLLMTDEAAQVRPVWVRRMVEAQHTDGGWLPFQSLAKLAPGLRLGVGLYTPVLKSDETSFHTTAQAMLVLALLLNQVAPE